MSQLEAQFQAKQNIRNLWFGQSGYYWIDNIKYINVLLPPNTSVEGTSRYDLQDVNGKYIVRELVDGAVKDGEVFVDYWFPKPGEVEASEKLGFTMLFEPWGWIIGTGEYIDYIADSVKKLEEENIRILNESIYSSVEGNSYPFIKTRENKYIAYVDQSKIGTIVKSVDKKTGEDLTEKYFKVKEGPVEYWYTKAGEPENEFFKKIGYVKYFEKMDWIIVYTQYEDEVLASMQSVKKVLLIISILSLLILSAFLFIFLTMIMKTLVRTTQKMNEIAEGSGDLTFRLQTNSNDEMGKMAKSFNLMMSRIQALIIKLKESADTGETVSLELSSNTEEIASASEEMAAGAQSIKLKSKMLAENAEKADNELSSITSSMKIVSEQSDTEAAAVEQSSAAIEEMIASIKNITRISQERTSQIRQLSVAARQGKQEMELTVSDIKEIAGSADSISEVLSVIDGISQQINLLSMNAAIEAAHAGDAGRGFAVVAEEIRKLADSTAENSNSIDQEIKQIINQIHEASSRSASTGESIDLIAEEAEQSSNAMEEIVMALDELSQGTNQITDALNSLVEASANVKESSKNVEASTEISKQTLIEITGLSEENDLGIIEISSGMDEISSAILHIRDLVLQNKEAMSDINDLIGNFKV